MTPGTYAVQVSAELAEQHREWTRLADVPNASRLWFRIVPRDGGTADVELMLVADDPAAADRARLRDAIEEGA